MTDNAIPEEPYLGWQGAGSAPKDGTKVDLMVVNLKGETYLAENAYFDTAWMINKPGLGYVKMPDTDVVSHWMRIV